MSEFGTHPNSSWYKLEWPAPPFSDNESPGLSEEDESSRPGQMTLSASVHTRATIHAFSLSSTQAAPRIMCCEGELLSVLTSRGAMSSTWAMSGNNKAPLPPYTSSITAKSPFPSTTTTPAHAASSHSTPAVALPPAPAAVLQPAAFTAASAPALTMTQWVLLALLV
ncbi:hypothetical protein C8Q80DRAFT_1118273 [Daedaleopsis nitida]|nr:hypothetical protein C8Q80DRAFT_1118273 [Daedaleopsis nitida]